MRYFNSGFLRTYDGLGPDTNGDAITYYCDLKKSYLGVSTRFDFFLLISFFLLLLFSLLLCLPFCFISLFLCGFPLFGEGQGFLLRRWLVSGRSQKIWFGTGTSWSATWYKKVKEGPRKKALMLGLSLQPGGTGRWAQFRAPQRIEGPCRGPRWECLEVVLVALETCPLLLLALNMPEAHQAEPLFHP